MPTNAEKFRMLQDQRNALYQEQRPIREAWIAAANKVLETEDPKYKSGNWRIPSDAQMALSKDGTTLHIEWEIYVCGGSDTVEQAFPVALLEDDEAIAKLVIQRAHERESKAAEEKAKRDADTERNERATLARLKAKYEGEQP